MCIFLEHPVLCAFMCAAENYYTEAINITSKRNHLFHNLLVMTVVNWSTARTLLIVHGVEVTTRSKLTGSVTPVVLKLRCISYIRQKHMSQKNTNHLGLCHRKYVRPSVRPSVTLVYCGQMA